VVHWFNGHPPDKGATVLRQAVSLEGEWTAPILRFTARVRERAVTTGVGFSVLINGKSVWTWSTAEPAQEDGEVDLMEFREHPFLIEWMTDSMGPASFDWAVWLEPRIEERD
jgi:hypothetical protein